MLVDRNHVIVSPLRFAAMVTGLVGFITACPVSILGGDVLLAWIAGSLLFFSWGIAAPNLAKRSKPLNGAKNGAGPGGRRGPRPGPETTANGQLPMFSPPLPAPGKAPGGPKGGSEAEIG